jgi:hypothetical protein
VRVNRGIAVLLAVLGSVSAFFAANASPWLPVALLLIGAAVFLTSVLAERRPDGVAAFLLFRSFGPRTDAANLSRRESLRSARQFFAAFVVFASAFAGLMFARDRVSQFGIDEDLALAGALIFVLPMFLCLAGAAAMTAAALFARRESTPPMAPALCNHCGARTRIEYIRLGAPIRCTSCDREFVAAVPGGERYPVTQWHITYADFQQLVGERSYRTAIEPLLGAWFDLRIVDRINDVSLVTGEGTELDPLALHLRIQADPEKQYALYQCAMSL